MHFMHLLWKLAKADSETSRPLPIWHFTSYSSSVIGVKFRPKASATAW
jgi:hypothetical protein